jgi:hypothetical protein
MALVIPVPTQELGPNWAYDWNASLTILDGHSHVAGSGVFITPAAININANLAMNDFFLAMTGAVVFLPQNSTPPNDSLYVLGVDLHFIDGNGNDIPLTAGGVVNATSSGISSGTATAQFIGGMLVVDSAPLTPANIQAGSYLMGNNVASSNFVTLQPQNPIASSYSLTLPIIPAVFSVMTLDIAGNIGTETSDQVVSSITSAGADGIAELMTSTGANAIASNITAIPAANANGIVNSINSISAATANLIVDSISLVSVGAANIIASTISFLANSNVTINSSDGAVLPITSFANPSNFALAICRGVINSNGTRASGEGFSSSQPSTGVYQVTFFHAFFDLPAVVVTPAAVGGTGYTVLINSISQSGFTCSIGSPISLANAAICFIAIGQR